LKKVEKRCARLSGEIALQETTDLSQGRVYDDDDDDNDNNNNNNTLFTKEATGHITLPGASGLGHP
jgi:hypothetical protein